MTQKKLKYTYILRISIAIRCDVSKKTFFSMITLNARPPTTPAIARYYYNDQSNELNTELNLIIRSVQTLFYLLSIIIAY